MAFVTVNTNARAVGRYAETLSDLLDDAVVETATAVAATAIENAPEDTGALKASIVVVTWKGNRGQVARAMARAKALRPKIHFEPVDVPQRRGQANVIALADYAVFQERKSFFMAKARRTHERTFRNAVRRAVNAVKV